MLSAVATEHTLTVIMDVFPPGFVSNTTGLTVICFGHMVVVLGHMANMSPNFTDLLTNINTSRKTKTICLKILKNFLDLQSQAH